MEVRPIGEHDVAALQALLESGTAFAEQVTGYPTGPSDALSTLLMLPPDLPEDAKTVLGLWSGEALLGVADVLVGHPDEATVTIGLLLIHPGHRRAGLGRHLVGAVARLADGRALRAGVVDTNDSGPFWCSVGFEPQGDAVPYRYDQLASTMRHWRRAT